MAAIRPAPFYLNGGWWRDVSDETTGGMTYSIDEIERGVHKYPVATNVIEIKQPDPIPILMGRHERRKAEKLARRR